MKINFQDPVQQRKNNIFNKFDPVDNEGKGSDQVSKKLIFADQNHWFNKKLHQKIKRTDWRDITNIKESD